VLRSVTEHTNRAIERVISSIVAKKVGPLQEKASHVFWMTRIRTQLIASDCR
jgi:hypothetical protein